MRLSPRKLNRFLDAIRGLRAEEMLEETLAANLIHLTPAAREARLKQWEILSAEARGEAATAIIKIPAEKVADFLKSLPKGRR